MQGTAIDDRAVVERLVAGGGGAMAEVFRGSFDTLEVRFTAGEVKTALARESSGVGLRLIRDGRLGFVGSRDTSPEGLERLLASLESSLEVGDRVEYSLPAPAEAPVAAEALGLYREATAALSVDDLVRLGRALLGPLKARHPGVVYEVTARRSIGRTTLTSSTGVATTSRYTVVSLGVEANRTRDEDVLLDFGSAAAPDLASLAPEELAERLARRLTWAEETVTLRPGRMPVLFTPSGGMVLWSPLLQALSGKTVMLGTSPLRERLGEAILSPAVEVVDDGLLPGALGSAPFDDEGVPRQRRALIEDGVLRGFVHDLETAAATGSAPTGNGERGGATGQPSPGFANLLVRGGERSWRDLIAGIDRGLLVQSVIGMGQGNTLPGTFSNPIDVAFLIEGGEVKGRVKDVSIAGNVYELLGPQLGALSSEVERLGGSTFLPWVRIDDVNVVGKGSA